MRIEDVLIIHETEPLLTAAQRLGSTTHRSQRLGHTLAQFRTVKRQNQRRCSGF
jgi:hypothetical protein